MSVCPIGDSPWAQLQAPHLFPWTLTPWRSGLRLCTGLHTCLRWLQPSLRQKVPSCSSVSFRQAGESEPSSSSWELLAGYWVESNLITEAVRAILVDIWGSVWDRDAYSDLKRKHGGLIWEWVKSLWICVSARAAAAYYPLSRGSIEATRATGISWQAFWQGRPSCLHFMGHFLPFRSL